VSLVAVSIRSNPSGGVLSPYDGLRAEVKAGIAQFTNLQIDKAGFSYQLSFSLLRKDNNKFMETSVRTVG